MELSNKKVKIGLKAIALICAYVGLLSFFKLANSFDVSSLLINLVVGAISSWAAIGLWTRKKYSRWSAILSLIVLTVSSMYWLWFVFSPIFKGHVNTPDFLTYLSLIFVLISITGIWFLFQKPVKDALNNN